MVYSSYKKMERTLENMSVGESGFITPWTLQFSKSVPILYIKREYKEGPNKVARMFVERIGPGRGDFRISMPDNYKWPWYMQEGSHVDDEYWVSIKPENISR